MDTEWLAVLREVAHHGSVTGAARALGYTQSAVSRQVAALEKATGAHLFDRLPRGVRLTDDGRCLLVHAEAVLDRLETARRDLAALRGAAAGRLRLGAFDTAGAVLLPRALASFRADHPGVDLSVLEANTPALLQRLDSGDVDLAIVSAYPGGALDETRYALRFLAEDPLLVALPASRPRATAERLTLRELADENWIEGFPPGASTLVDACVRAGFRPRIDFAVREWTAKQGFVAAGLGLALVPALGASAARPDIVLVPLAATDAPVRSVYAATPRHVTAPATAAAFLPHLVAAAPRLAP